ncbi:hypothetical protein Tco_0702285 [Tanacetum coccineum]|uniref:Uncharacterized protein n=1 Tax=Tanacetum coccineum TaxID=301880 RepID=A0ABQ4XVJ6_9ASTR
MRGGGGGDCGEGGEGVSRMWSRGVSGDNDKEEVVPRVDDVSLFDEVFDGAFGGDGDENFVIGEGVVLSSSSLKRSTKSCLGGMIVSLIFLEGFEEEACVEAMDEEEK